MGDDEGGPVLHEPLQRRLHLPLRLGIQRRCGLVEDEDGGVPDNGPRNADPLALTAGEPHAALADDGVIPLGHLHDEFMGMGGTGRLDDALLRGVLSAVGDVCPDGVVEEHHLLGHHGDVHPERFHGDIADVIAAYDDPSGGCLEESREEIGDGSLSRAGLPDQGDAAAFLGLEAHPFQGILLARVGEGDVLKLELAVYHAQIDGIGFVRDFRHGVQDVEYPLRRGDSLLDLDIDRVELADRRVEHAHRQDEGCKVAGREGAGHDLHAPVPEDEGAGEPSDELHQGARYGPDRNALHPVAVVSAVLGGEAPFLVLFHVVSLHDPDAADALVQDAHDVAHDLHAFGRVSLEHLAELADGINYQREYDHGDQRQLRAPVEHHDHEPDEFQRLSDELGHGVGDR